MVAVTLELEHAVDEVLEHTGTGDGSVLGHVTDEKRRDTGCLRDPQDPRGCFTHLRDRAWRGRDVAAGERLYRVDHADGGALALEGRAHHVEVGLGEDLDCFAAPDP